MKKVIYFLIVFLLIVASSQFVFADQRLYHFAIRTGDFDAGGTKSDISIKLYGTLGETDSQKVGSAFPRGQRVELNKSYPDVGVIWKIEVQNAMNADDKAWYLSYIDVSSTMPTTIQETSFSFNCWIDTTNIYPLVCDGYQPPQITGAIDTGLSKYKAYIYDNLTGTTTSNKITVTNQLTVSVSNQYSNNIETKQTSELSANWGVNIMDVIKIGGDYKGMWESAISSSATSTINLTSVQTNTFDITADPGCYTIKILQERYDFTNRWFSDSFAALLFREMKANPIVTFPKVFNFGPSYPVVTWHDFTVYPWGAAIKTSLAQGYDSIVQTLQSKGYLGMKPSQFKQLKYKGPLPSTPRRLIPFQIK